jgi:hypothetical protein
MICFVNPGLKRELAEAGITVTCLYVRYVHVKRPSIFIRDKLILSSERMLHKDYDLKGSVERRISGRHPQGAWRQDELIGGKLPVVK